MKVDSCEKRISESRKVRKPLMEKKRRARINDSLDALKQILLDSKTTLKESTGGSNSHLQQQRTAKLEKADILEMTVRYVQHLRKKLFYTSSNKSEDDCLSSCSSEEEEIAIRAADSSSTCSSPRLLPKLNNNQGILIEGGKDVLTLIPKKLSNGLVVYVTERPKSNNCREEEEEEERKEFTVKVSENMWRPW